MDQKLQARLNQILDRVTAAEFLDSSALGGEIAFWIFDYSPNDELKVREYIAYLERDLKKKHSSVNYGHLNLLQLMVGYLEGRGLLDKAIKLQLSKGDDALVKALAGPLHMDKFVPYLLKELQPDNLDLVFISGVGSVWPLIRMHSLLNALHSSLGNKPLVLFYPGEYTGQTMKLFEQIQSNNYYRAFKLVP